MYSYNFITNLYKSYCVKSSVKMNIMNSASDSKASTNNIQIEKSEPE